MLAQKADMQVVTQMLGTKAEVDQYSKTEEDIKSMSSKIEHLVIFQNEMLALMDTEKPKTGHYRNEAVLVD
jgi:hypothetical protein